MLQSRARKARQFRPFTDRSVTGDVLERFGRWLTQSRLLFVAIGLVPATLLFEIVGIWADPVNRWQFPLGHDFVAFWSAARLYSEGGASLLYDIGAYAALQYEVSVRPGLLLWHYPPFHLMLIIPLAGLSFAVGFLAFTAANLAALAAIASRLLPFPGLVGWAALFGAPVMAASIVQGQNGPFFAACLIGGFMARNRGQFWLSAVLFAVVMAKPQYGVLVPVALIALRDWQAILRTAVAGSAFAALTTIALGPAIWASFLGNTPMLSLTLTETELLAQMPTIWAALSLSGLAPGAAGMVHVLGAFVAIAIVWRLWADPAAQDDIRLASLLLGTLAISPYGFQYDMILTLAGTLLLIRHARVTGVGPLEKLVLAAMWLAPAVFPALALATGIHIGPVISFAGLAICIYRRSDIDRRITAPTGLGLRTIGRRRRATNAGRNQQMNLLRSCELSAR